MSETRYEFAEQYSCVCVVINDNDTAESVINDALENEAVYFDGEDNLLCVRFPNRPQEVYTESALARSFPLKGEKMPTKEHCCQIDCEKDAEWEIYADGVPDTTACTEHVGELLTDAKEHRIFRIITSKILKTSEKVKDGKEDTKQG